jgi:hypothetical protein
MAFKSAAARPLPQLACIGYIDEIKEVKETESGVYLNARVSIKGNDGVSRNSETNLLFRPDWFTPGFDPEGIKNLDFEDLDATEQQRVKTGLSLTYARLFGRGEAPGQLAVMAGSQENYDKLADLFTAAYKGTEFTGEEIVDIIRGFILDKCPDVGYVLRQQKEKTDQVDENGKAVYVLRDGYEINEWFFPNAANKKRLMNRAVKSAEKAVKTSTQPDFKVAFES